MNIKDSNVLITGGASGIGLEIAKLVLSQGGRPVLVDNNKSLLEKCKTVLQRYQIKPLYYYYDLSEMENHKLLFDELVKNHIIIDLLINNVAITKHKDFRYASWGEIQRIINVNILCSINLCHLFLPSMIKNGNGAILNISSTAGKIACPHLLCYSASKSFINSFSETLSMELKGTGVQAKYVCIGATDTDFFKNACMLDMNYTKNIKKMDPSKVAIECLNIVLKNKGNKIIGIRNKLNMLITKFIPEFLLHNISTRRFK